jgi:cell division protein FtsA
MHQGDYRAAVDIGTTKVCAIIAAKRVDGAIEMIGIGSAPCDGIRRNTVADVPAISRAVRAAVDAASSQAKMAIDKVYIGISGAHIRTESRWTPVPREHGVTTITDEDIHRALGTVAHRDPSPGRDVLHVLPRSYTLDGVHGVRNPTGMHSGELHVQSQVITAATDQVEALEDAVRLANLRPAGTVVEPMATADAVLNADERSGAVVLMDIGGTKTDVSVFQDGLLVHTVVVPIGGHNFTNDLAISFSLPYAEAEKLKVEHGTVIADVAGPGLEFLVKPAGMDDGLMITQRDVGQVLRDRAEELFEIVRIKLAVPEVAGLTLDRVVLTGGGSKLESLTTLAKHTLQMKVRKATPRGIEGMPEASRDPSQAAAMGLIIWGMTNLPAENHLARVRQPAVKAARLPGQKTNVFGSVRNWWTTWGAGSDQKQLAGGAGQPGHNSVR